MNEPKYIPEFATEEEELEFWDTHRIQDYDMGPADDIIWDIGPRRRRRAVTRVQWGRGRLRRRKQAARKRAARR